MEQNGEEGFTCSVGPQDGFAITGVVLGNGGAREGASGGREGVYIGSETVQFVVETRVIKGLTTFEYRWSSDPFQMRLQEIA